MLNPQLWLAQRQLAAKSSQTRLRAVQKLRQRGGVEGLSLFVTAIGDDDALVRAEAAAALGELEEPDAVTPLIRALHDPASEVQEAAAQALKRIGDTSATNALLDALRRGAPGVRWRAAQTLQALDWHPETPEDELEFCVASGDLRRAASFGPAAVAPIARVLKEGDYAQRVLAASVLGDLAAPAVLKPLLAALKDRDPLVRTAAADALARQQGPGAVNGLVGALKDRDRNVRSSAATALGRLGDELAVEPLMATLQDKEWQVRAAALEALGRLGSRRALDPVAACLKDPDTEVRQHAAAAVGLLGSEASLEKLIPNLVDADAGVRQATAAALGRISPHWERSEFAQRMVEKLQTGPRHADSGVEYAAMLLIKRVAGMGTAELARASERPHAAQRLQLTARVFAGLLRDRDAVVRLAAAEATARLGMAACAAALRQAVEDPDTWVRRAVREALADLAKANP
jgi:HEAT repeat protein